MRGLLNTIIVGCDGRSRGLQAVSVARLLADATGARLLLVAVCHDPAMPFPLTLVPHPTARHEAEVAIASVRDQLAPAARAIAVPDFSPAHALRRLAREHSADLVVVGSRHPSAASRMLDGDHALQVLHGAPCAVTVVPEQAPPRGVGLHSIAVGVDGSPESVAALTLAREIARAAGATLTAAFVIPDRPPGWITSSSGLLSEAVWMEQLDACREDGRALLDGILGPGAEDVVRTVVVGSPVERLTHLAEESDLMVLGSRRWGPLRRLALGSTSEAVVRRANAPVLVLPRGVDHPRIGDPPAAALAGAR